MNMSVFLGLDTSWFWSVGLVWEPVPAWFFVGLKMLTVRRFWVQHRDLSVWGFVRSPRFGVFTVQKNTLASGCDRECVHVDKMNFPLGDIKVYLDPDLDLVVQVV